MEIERSETEIKAKPCPVCGKPPIFATTIIGTYFLMCIGHCETAGCSTAEEAIALWNAGKYEECDAPKDGGLQLDQGDWPVL